MDSRLATFRSAWLAYGELIFVTTLAIAFTAVAGNGHDFYPLIWALRLKLAGNSAYSPEMELLFRQYFPPKDAAGGFAYPLPAMWLALPLFWLPESINKIVFDLLAIGLVVAGLRLARLPLVYLFFFPVIIGLSLRNITIPLVGLLLIGVWALRERRWWILGPIIGLTIAAKPQATALIALVLLVLACRAGGWRQISICVLVVLGLTTLLEPAWPLEWIAAVTRYGPTQQLASLLWCVPFAAVLLGLGQPWAALAVVQVCLFPVMQKYALSPFVLGYLMMPGRRLAWFAVLSSWLLMLAEGAMPAWQAVGVSYLPPLLLGAAWLFWRQRQAAKLILVPANTEQPVR